MGLVSTSDKSLMHVVRLRYSEPNSLEQEHVVID